MHSLSTKKFDTQFQIKINLFKDGFIEVSDDGIGIKKKDLKKIVEEPSRRKTRARRRKTSRADILQAPEIQTARL